MNIQGEKQDLELDFPVYDCLPAGVVAISWRAEYK